MGDAEVAINFDETGNVRVLDTEKFKDTQEIDKECTTFMTKIKEFEGTVHTLVEVLDGQSKKIEQEKLKAIGQRNRVEGEAENRKRKQEETRAQIREKQAELDRCVSVTACMPRVFWGGAWGGAMAGFCFAVVKSSLWFVRRGPSVTCVRVGSVCQPVPLRRPVIFSGDMFYDAIGCPPDPLTRHPRATARKPRCLQTTRPH